MYVFDLGAVKRALDALDSNWKEFMRVGSLSVGLYRVKAGEPDAQAPHTEDEIYYVLRGVAKFSVSDSVQEVSAGSVIYVEAGREHRFVEVAEDLEVLVIFAPAEGSARPRE